MSVGKTYDTNLTLLIRNRTPDSIHSVRIDAVARDAAGSLIGTGASHYAVIPSIIKPGEWGAVEVGFSTDDLDADTDVEYTVGYSTVEADNPGRVDLELPELAVRTPDDTTVAIDGIVQSSYTEDVTGPTMIVGVCIQDEVPVERLWGFAGGTALGFR